MKWISTLIFNISYRIKAAFLRPLAEFFGLSWFSRMEIMGLDKVIDKYLDFENGVFIEAGAWDGILFSNTYFLEKFLNWKGILVEPIPEYADKCIKNRRNSKVFSCALVGNSYKKPSIAITQVGLGSIVDGAMEDSYKQNHVQAIKSVSPWVYGGERVVPAKTLNNVIAEAGLEKIDFLSLDVEGYESEVLNGLNFNKFKPKFLLFEARDHFKANEVLKIVKKYYKTITKVSSIDYFCY